MQFLFKIYPDTKGMVKSWKHQFCTRIPFYLILVYNPKTTAKKKKRVDYSIILYFTEQKACAVIFNVENNLFQNL